MPRKEHPREYVRAYHRASAVLRERYIDEWNHIRLEILNRLLAGEEPGKLPPGPKKGPGQARSRHERREKNYDQLAQEHQSMKDALVITSSLLEDFVDGKQTESDRRDAIEQININQSLIEETKGL